MDGYITGNGYMVTWALGHLVSLALPGTYGYTRTTAEDLPMIPEPFRLVPRQIRTDRGMVTDIAAGKQLKIIDEVFSKCDSIIVATDAGREGELIFRWIYSYLGYTKPFRRLWISSLTDEAIREGMANLREGSGYDSLYAAADSRAKADWLVGMNASRALATASGSANNSIGRVQTPTLAMICARFKENRNFVSTPYWQLHIALKKDDVHRQFFHPEDFRDKNGAEAAYRRITSDSVVTINKVDLLAELNYKRFMFKKLCIFLIFSKLKVAKLLIDQYRMHNLYAIFAKLLNICKQIAGNLVNESGNVPRRGVVPKFSDLEVVALNMASEAVGIDSESLLFAKLQEYRVEIPNLISRRQYNDRRKITSSLCHAIREKMVSEMDGDEDYFCIDSKPIEVCRIARSKRCSMGKKDYKKAPGVGYCASQSMYYYGYKLHAVCGLSGVIHSFDLTKASVHDIHYLKDVKVDYSNCTVIGDRGYISAQVQLDLFETANIRLEVPYRCNQKEWKPTFPAFAKARKRIETLFSQLCDQFMIIRNYAKDTDGLFARIIGKISALTILQYINYKNEKPIGRVKYALF